MSKPVIINEAVTFLLDNLMVDGEGTVYIKSMLPNSSILVSGSPHSPWPISLREAFKIDRGDDVSE